LVLIGRRSQDTLQEFPPGVSYLGSWPHAAVLEAWRRCLIGVAPSIWGEPFATVLLEAMAAGKPVVATRIGGSPDIVADGETGLMVAPQDPEDLRQGSHACCLTSTAALSSRAPAWCVFAPAQ
jgi:glycosyltransferase involved in cell wall biosynthesis